MKKTALWVTAAITALSINAQTSEYEGLEIINNVPAGGQVTTYSRSADVFYDDFGDLMTGKDDGSCGEIVIFENGDCYIKNPISTYTTDSYILGTLEGNTIRCRFPQKLFHNYLPLYGVDENYYIHRLNLSNRGNELVYEIPAQEDDYIDFTLNDDGTVTMQPTEIDEATDCPVFLMGMTVFEEEFGEGWMGFGDWNQVYGTFNDSLTVAPEGVEFEQWRMDFWQELGKWNQDRRFINVAIDGNDAYISGFYYDFPDAVIKGSVEGDQISFPSGQYIGVDSGSNHYAYFLGCKTETYFNTETEALVPYLVREDALVFEYNAEDKQMWTDAWFTLNSGNGNDIFPIFYYGEPTIQYQEPFEPADPKNPSWMIGPVFDDGSGYWLISIPKTDVNGNLLNTDKMYYNIFVDDELFYLYADETPGITEDMCNIPYNFTNNYDLFVNGELHQVPYMLIGYNEISVQSVYVADDGTEYKSEKVVNTTSVSNLDADSAVIATERFDIQGRRLSSNAKGIVITRQTLDNGSIRVVKEIVK